MAVLLQTVCQILAPGVAGSAVEKLCASPANSLSHWQEVYDIVTIQWLAPLLYEILRKQDNRLGVVPEKICNQLRNDCLENRLRNHLFRQELRELLVRFNSAGIAVILLKGSATFADDLYGCLGGRPMLDLDLLVRPEQVERARSLLETGGYIEVCKYGDRFAGNATDQRHAHINGYRKPGTPVLVELHYNIAYGMGGRILPTEEGWQHAVEVEVLGVPALVLDPTRRVLHTTVHGLIPSCDYIKGRIRLWHLLEFAWLAHRYGNEIDWSVWLAAATRQGYATAFLAWLHLAHVLLAVPLPRGRVIGWWPRLHGAGLLQATLTRDWASGALLGGQRSWRDQVWRLLHAGHYFSHLPAWVWGNVCYAPGWRQVPVRLGCVGRKMRRKESWAKV